MMSRCLIIASTLAAAASPALPCGNALPKSDAVALVARAELLLERDEPARAVEVIRATWFRPYIDDDPGDRLRIRLEDLQVIAKLRAGVAAETSKHFATRATEKSPQLAAWLAEAYASEGKHVAARSILRSLRTRDLMPDAFAYRTLARVTRGGERRAAIATCRRRTNVKSICT